MVNPNRQFPQFFFMFRLPQRCLHMEFVRFLRQLCHFLEPFSQCTMQRHSITPSTLFLHPPSSRSSPLPSPPHLQALRVIETEGVTRFIGVPTMVRDMLEHPSFTPERTKTVKNMMAGGAPVPPAQVAKMRAQAKGACYATTEPLMYQCFSRGRVVSYFHYL